MVHETGTRMHTFNTPLPFAPFALHPWQPHFIYTTWSRGGQEAAIAEMVPLVATLAPNRTPGIMWRALADTENCRLPRAPVAEGENGGHDDGEDRVVLERHGNQALVPRRWLYHGLVFDYAEPELFL
uniref:Uncharacterized protein n=1 Tax=Heterosigma akashiwo TaxID=2829 RepID=A0A7S3XP49_HETAK